MSEPLTREQPATRFMIPRHFSYTRFDNENVEVVLATDYDALQAKLAACERSLQTMRDVNDHDARYQEELEARLAAVGQERDALRQAGQP